MSNISYKYFPSGDIDYSGSGIVLQDVTLFSSFEFEKIDWQAWGRYTNTNWHFPIYAGLVYILVIFGIQNLMKNRKAFELKMGLFLWNAAIGIYSIVAFLRLGLLLIQGFWNSGGIYNSVCLLQQSKPVAFWTLTFIFSKYVELGDTVLIVLRKKPLQLIQWYHHVITLFACWHCYGFFEPIVPIYAVVNAGVHSLMYPYFALKALNVQIPRRIAQWITTLQLGQMIIGFSLNSYTGYSYYSGSPCVRHPGSTMSFSLVYGSFIILFGQLFYNLVLAKPKEQKKID